MSTTSHNISNAGTPGYSRQVVTFNERTPTATGAGFFGNGVDVTGVTRRYEQFLTNQVWSNTSTNARQTSFYQYASEVDNLLADPQAGLAPALQSFFDSVQSLSNDPASIPARQVVLSEAGGLVDRFQSIVGKFSDLNDAVNSDINSQIGEINTLAQGIAKLNHDIVFAEGRTPGQQANDLRDQRDYLIQQLSERVGVTVNEQDNGAANVFIGSGQTLVIGDQSYQLGSTDKAVYDEPGKVDITLSGPGGIGTAVVTNLLTGGSLGGLLDFRSEILDPAVNAMGRLAVGLSTTFNDQHHLGLDLLNNFGGDFFTDLTGTAPVAYQKNSNNGNAQLNLSITDVSQLTTSDYVLSYDGTTYKLTRQSDGKVTNLADLSLGPDTVDGLTLSIASGTMAAGDTFLIRPTAAASTQMGVEVTDPVAIAAAGAVRAAAGSANNGTGVIAPPDVVDTTTYVAGNYTIYAAAGTTAIADAGVTAGTITDDPTTANALQYRLEINGYTVYTQTEADAPLTDLSALAAEINDDEATTGVRAYVDTTTNQLLFTRVPPSQLPITVTETLEDSGGTAMDAADNITGYFGGALTGAAPTNTLTYSSADSYAVDDGTGTVVTSGTYTAGATIAFNGIETSISGRPLLGDTFSLEPNIGGSADNRNALKLMGLQTAKTLNQGTSNFQNVYGQMVAVVGTSTHRADLERTASQSLLDQAVASREQVSGVNLDEEAANLLKYQQLYQASAQVISIGNSLFQSLLSAIG